MQFLGVHWDNESQKPSLNFKSVPNSGNEERKPLEISSNFAIEIKTTKHCIGFHNPPKYNRENCPDNVDLTGRDEHQCAKCRYSDSKYFLPLDVISQQSKEELKTLKHYNYLNLFGTNIVKIGVAADNRQYTRLLEQGAFASILFAVGNGYNTRMVEDYISRALKIRQAVSWQTKIKLMNRGVTPAQAFAVLDEIYRDVVDILDKHFQSGVTLINEHLFLLDRYNLPLSSKISELTYIDDISLGSVVSGKLIGVYGQLLVFEIGNITAVLNSKSILGHDFTISKNVDNSSHSSTDFATKKITFINHTPEGGLF
ncbi:MAG: DUF2797 domain-containing protein [Patescibacteria group bacterium]